MKNLLILKRTQHEQLTGINNSKNETKDDDLL